MAKPKAQRKLVRRNGKLQVIYVDENGVEITGPIEAYDLEDSMDDGGYSTGNPTSPTKDEEKKPTTTTPTSSSNTAVYGEQNTGLPFNNDPNKPGLLSGVFGNIGSMFEGFTSPPTSEEFEKNNPSPAARPQTQNPSTTPLSPVVGGGAPIENPQLAKVVMANSGASRNRPVSQDTINEIQAGVTAVYGPGYVAKIISGGQNPDDSDHVGTRRHDTKTAADVLIYDPSGRQLVGGQLLPIAQHWLATDVGSVGFPLTADQSLHLDLIGGKGQGSVPLMSGEGKIWYYGGSPSKQIASGISAGLNGKTPSYVINPQQVKEIQRTVQTPPMPMNRPPALGVPVTPQQQATIPKTGFTAPSMDETRREQAELTGILGSLKQQVGDSTPITPPPYDPGLNFGYSPNLESGIIETAGTQYANPMTGESRMVEQAGSSTIPAGYTPDIAKALYGTPEFELLGKEQASIQTAPKSNIQPGPTAIAAIYDAVSDPDEIIKMAYLEQINYAEGSPKYNTLFGHQDIDLSSPDHPNIKKYYDNGNAFSTAAGYGQFTYGTWNDVNSRYFGGSLDFSSEEDQKTAMWKLAENNYMANTGRVLLDDLKSGNPDVIGGTFVNNANRWSSLPGGLQPRTNVNELVEGFNARVSTARNMQEEEVKKNIAKTAEASSSNLMSVNASTNALNNYTKMAEQQKAIESVKPSSSPAPVATPVATPVVTNNTPYNEGSSTTNYSPYNITQTTAPKATTTPSTSTPKSGIAGSNYTPYNTTPKTTQTTASPAKEEKKTNYSPYSF